MAFKLPGTCYYRVEFSGLNVCLLVITGQWLDLESGVYEDQMLFDAWVSSLFSLF